MGKYVDADKLRLEIKNMGLFETAKFIKSFPLEDVAPVTHAHWRWTLNYHVICSKCQYVLPSGFPVSDFRFCPYCGANMDEEVE